MIELSERWVRSMLQYERYAFILNRLKETGTVTVSVLSKDLQVSESTIRRDITDLDHAGRLKKVFGGAVRRDEERIAKFMNMADKSAANVDEKREIAAYAASLIRDNEYVYLDAGTTTGALIEFLDNKTVTYVTNASRHALELAAKGLQVFLIGGMVRTDTESIVGSVAVENIRRFHFDRCFMGVDAIDVHLGLTTSNTEEGMIKTEAVRHGQHVYILADHSKFDQISHVTFAGLEAGCIITDREPDPNYKKLTEVIVTKGKEGNA